MKKLPTLLIIFIVGQIMPASVYASGTTIGASYTSFNSLGNNLINKDFASLTGTGYNPVSTPAAADSTGVAHANVTISSPALVFTGKTALDAGNGNNIAIIDRSTNTGFVASSDTFNLDSGNILISPEKNIVIGTKQGLVSIESGATIFLMESGADTVIYDLYQSKAKQVSVVVNKHKLVMEPGRMLVLTEEKTRNFQDLDANYHFVSYHRAQEVNLQGDKVNAYQADFSIFSALTRIQPLKQLITSKDKHDQVLLQKLLKTAAMLRT